MGGGHGDGQGNRQTEVPGERPASVGRGRTAMARANRVPRPDPRGRPRLATANRDPRGRAIATRDSRWRPRPATATATHDVRWNQRRTPPVPGGTGVPACTPLGFEQGRSPSATRGGEAQGPPGRPHHDSAGTSDRAAPCSPGPSPPRPPPAPRRNADCPPRWRQHARHGTRGWAAHHSVPGERGPPSSPPPARARPGQPPDAPAQHQRHPPPQVRRPGPHSCHNCRFTPAGRGHEP